MGNVSPAAASPQLFTEEQELFRQNVRRFVETEIIPQVDEWEKEERIPRPIWQRFGELGYLGVEYPGNYGGSESTFLSTLVFIEELARCRSMGVAISITVHTDMATPYILRLGSAEQKQKYLPPLIAGEQICAIAVTEPGAGSDVAAIQTRAEKQGKLYRLNGSKTFITNGVYGDVFVVAARTDKGRPDRRHEGISLFVVERGTKGFAVSRKLEKIGWWASDTAELSFEDCEIPLHHLLGQEGQGFKYIMQNFQRERLVLAIIAYASAGRALEDAVAYARERKAFGRPLIGFQTMRHRLAEMATSYEAARQFVRHVARLYEAKEAGDDFISMAKLVATRAASQIADDAVQVFGGYGCMQEFRIERFYRDARILPIGGGTSEILKDIVAKRMGLDDTGDGQV